MRVVPKRLCLCGNEKKPFSGRLEAGLADRNHAKGGHPMKDKTSLSHTQWKCKYHVVFAPKYRRQVIYGKIKTDLGTILRRLCEYKKIEILEASLCKDHVHMLLSIPPK